MFKVPYDVSNAKIRVEFAKNALFTSLVSFADSKLLDSPA